MELRGLYAITDADLTPFDTFIDQITAVILGGAKIIQFRYKGEITADVLIKLSEIQTLCKRHEVLFIINDHKELAKEIGADGLHVGKEDEEDLQNLRKKFAGKILGVSCYGDMQRAKKAESFGADYVAFGSFFHSPTKPNSGIVPIEIIQEAKATLKVPVCVIGGITTDNAKSLVAQGADMISVISGLWHGDIVENAHRFAVLFEEKHA